MFNYSEGVVVNGGSLNNIQGDLHASYVTKIEARVPNHGQQILLNNIADGAMHNSKERYDAPRCHEDTRKAVLKDISNWISDMTKDTLILWLSAPAGAGKSAILQKVAEEFDHSGRLALARSIPAARRYIEEAVDYDPSIFSRTLQVQLERLITQPLVHASLDPQGGVHWPTLLVIDGLDECGGKENQVSILKAFQDALLKLRVSLPVLYLLIASRPETAIRQSFEHDSLSITHHIILDKSYDPDRDIAVFLRSSFSDILRRRRTQFPSMMILPQSWPSDDVISFLVEKSSGQFIFAATVIRFIDIDRRVPTSQLALLMNICQSTGFTRFETNPFSLLDQLYSFVLQSTEETEKVLSVLGVIFHLNGDQDPTLDFLASLLDVDLQELTLLFWDLHSIVHVPNSGSGVIRFYHASFRDYLVNPYRSKDLHVQEFKAHSLLCEGCLRTLSKWPPATTPADVHPGLHEPAVRYSSEQWAYHYTCGDKISVGVLDDILSKFNPSDCLALSDSVTSLQLIAWWDRFASARRRWHLRCNQHCSSLCSRYTSVFDRYLVQRYDKHEYPALVVAFLGLTVLLKIAPRPPHWVPEKDETHILDAAWWRGIISGTKHSDDLVYFLIDFLGDPARSKSLFLGKRKSDTHFAHLCVQTIWQAICRKNCPPRNTTMLKSLHDILEILILRTHTRNECDVGRTDARRIKMCIKVRMSELKELLEFDGISSDVGVSGFDTPSSLLSGRHTLFGRVWQELRHQGIDFVMM